MASELDPEEELVAQEDVEFDRDFIDLPNTTIEDPELATYYRENEARSEHDTRKRIFINHMVKTAAKRRRKLGLSTNIE